MEERGKANQGQKKRDLKVGGESQGRGKWREREKATLLRRTRFLGFCRHDQILRCEAREVSGSLQVLGRLSEAGPGIPRE